MAFDGIFSHGEGRWGGGVRCEFSVLSLGEIDTLDQVHMDVPWRRCAEEQPSAPGGGLSASERLEYHPSLRANTDLFK